MKCKIVGLGLVVATMLTILSVDGAQAQRYGKIKFLRPLQGQGHWAQSAGRSDGASTGRGLMKHLMMFRNMWQQPSSNVIIITRPTTTQQNDDTTTTTNTPTGTRAMPREVDKKDVLNDDEAEVEADHDDIDIIGTNTQNSLKGVSDKMSMESLHSRGSSEKKRNNKRHKKHRNSANRNSKRRKQIINVDDILKREEERRNGLENRRNGGRRTTANPIESSNNDSNNFRRILSSFRLSS